MDNNKSSKSFEDFLKSTNNVAENYKQEHEEGFRPVNLKEVSMADQIKHTQKDIFLSKLLGDCSVSLLTAPFQTAYITLQLSGFDRGLKANSNLLFNPPLNADDRLIRKYDALKKTNELNQTYPFRPRPSKGYTDVFKHLSTQGFQGFYKGNFLGVLNSMIVTQARFLLLYPLNNLSFYREIKSDSIKAFLHFGILTSIDMIFQPIHNLQSRFVLQNLQPNYRQYYSIAHAFSRHPLSELYRGSSAYIPINIIRSLTLSLIGLNSMEGLVLSFLLNHIITYPLTTVQRVMECQSHSVEGMIYKSNSEKKSNIDINN